MKKALLILAKIWGKVWIFACIPFRAYARNYVQNCVLQWKMDGKDGRKLWLGRLWEREPTLVDAEFRWYLKDIHNVNIEGYIDFRTVNKFQFYLIVFFIWGWLDDDSNEDTTDSGHIERAIANKPKWYDACTLILRPFLKPVDTVYGNSFDLGDVRSDHPYFHWANTALWSCRNTAMNFQYLWMGY